MRPFVSPTRTRLGFVGDTARALTVPPSWVLAWVQLDAPFTVRQTKRPPVHNLWESLGSIMKGVMKRPESLMPLVGLEKLAPPLVDFLIAQPWNSA